MQHIPEKLVQSYSFSPERRHAFYRRTLAVVIISQIFGGAGLAAGVTVGALLAQQMLGTAGLAGIPAALFTLGSAGAAFLVGQFSQRRAAAPAWPRDSSPAASEQPASSWQR
ncbi:uncharacterized MFS-type transporter YdeG [Arthrobacter sp. Hiyo4]|nr:uncharacterized MFS-type transporter YdeG [Arthrobacter sp. Hiyo4]